MPDPTPASSTAFPAPDTFRDQIAVVTGGGTGLGLEISRGLAAAGADVTILSRKPENHRALQDEAAERGWRVTARALDVREAHDVAVGHAARDGFSRGYRWQSAPVADDDATRPGESGCRRDATRNDIYCGYVRIDAWRFHLSGKACGTTRYPGVETRRPLQRHRI